MYGDAVWKVASGILIVLVVLAVAGCVAIARWAIA